MAIPATLSILIMQTMGGNVATTTLFSESEDLLDIRKDNIFKAVFTKDTSDSRRALSGLVSAIVGREMEVLDITANEPAPEDERDRQIRFDINCKTPDGEKVNVEMCLNPNNFEPVRLEFHFHEFEYYDPARKVPLGGRTRIFTVELAKLGEVAKKSVDEMGNAERWAVFFEYLTDPAMRTKINEIAERVEGIAMAGGVLLNISRNEVERARLESEYKGKLDLQTKLVDAKREGRREGEKRGVERRDAELLSLIDNGYTAADIKRQLEGGR